MYILINFVLETNFILVVFVGECESRTSETRFLSESCGGVISGTERRRNKNVIPEAVQLLHSEATLLSTLCALSVLQVVSMCSKFPLQHKSVVCYDQECGISVIKAKIKLYNVGGYGHYICFVSGAKTSTYLIKKPTLNGAIHICMCILVQTKICKSQNLIFT